MLDLVSPNWTRRTHHQRQTLAAHVCFPSEVGGGTVNETRGYLPGLATAFMGGQGLDSHTHGGPALGVQAATERAVDGLLVTSKPQSSSNVAKVRLGVVFTPHRACTQIYVRVGRYTKTPWAWGYGAIDGGPSREVTSVLPRLTETC